MKRLFLWMWVVVQPYIVAFGEKGWGPLHFGLGA